MYFIKQGTDTDAIGNYWLEIDPGELPTPHTVSKIEFIVNPLTFESENPTFPWKINMTKEQTRQLSIGKNVGYLYGYDEDGKRFRYDGRFEFFNDIEV